MFDITVLQRYAKKFESSSASLPPTLLLVNTETSLALFDKYPKATYHFLVLPRILPNSVFTAKDLSNLQTLLSKGKKAEAKALIEGLKQDAQAVQELMEKEMLKRHGYKWDVWIGFHAVPSMMYVLKKQPSASGSTRTPTYLAHPASIVQPLAPTCHLVGFVLAQLEAEETL